MSYIEDDLQNYKNRLLSLDKCKMKKSIKRSNLNLLQLKN